MTTLNDVIDSLNRLISMVSEMDTENLKNSLAIIDIKDRLEKLELKNS